MRMKQMKSVYISVMRRMYRFFNRTMSDNQSYKAHDIYDIQQANYNLNVTLEMMDASLRLVFRLQLLRCRRRQYAMTAMRKERPEEAEQFKPKGAKTRNKTDEVHGTLVSRC